MRIVAKGTLIEFWKRHADSKIGLLTWYDHVKNTKYDTPLQVIQDFKGADYIGNKRIVFNISKNKFRLIVSFRFEFNACWIIFIGTHAEYNKIDAKTIDFKH